MAAADLPTGNGMVKKIRLDANVLDDARVRQIYQITNLTATHPSQSTTTPPTLLYIFEKNKVCWTCDRLACLLYFSAFGNYGKSAGFISGQVSG